MKPSLLLCAGVVLIAASACDSDKAPRPTPTPQTFTSNRVATVPSGERRQTVYSGTARGRGTLELSGGVAANSNGTTITKIEFGVTLSAGGDPVRFDSMVTDGTVINYIDSNRNVIGIAYVATAIAGNADTLLEPGESLRIELDIVAAGVTLGANQTFTIELKPPAGSYMVLQRTTPRSLQPVMDLS